MQVKLKQKPIFIVLDGIDGCGSTTHSKMLKGYLESEGLKVCLTKEPTDSEIGKLLRVYLKNKEIPPTTDALLFAADRDLHYHSEIKKKLDEGCIVISDRYIESSIIYQSVSSTDISVNWVKLINKFAGKPDITIILDIDPRISLKRKIDLDLEKFEEMSFLKKVRTLYINRAKEEGYHLINSDEIIELVQENIQRIVNDRLK